VIALPKRTPQAIAYVACDPAAKARDLATAATLGYHPVRITAYDLFPMTHHVECVAILHLAEGRVG
jgi:tRNA/tmRNA/rRNA uracil-C5-methylase (TrmA/RlmC/RlmD family)